MKILKTALLALVMFIGAAFVPTKAHAQIGPFPCGGNSDISTFRPEVPYATGQVVIRYGVSYQSLSNNNQGNEPCFSPSQWSNVITGAGASSPSAPEFSLQAYGPGGTLTSDPNVTLNTTTHNLNAFSINNLANLASQSGAAGTGQFNSWIAAAIGSGNRGYLWLDPLATSGPPTSALTSLTRIIDARGTNCMDQTGTFTFADNSLCFEAGEDSQDSTTATTDKADVHVGYNSRKGGVYSFNGSSGVKSNRSALALNGDWQTVSQKWGVYGLLNSYTGGETIGFSAFMQEYGGYLGNGEEPSEGVRIEQQQATTTDSLGGIWKSTVTGISGSTVSFTSLLNSYTLGEARIIRDLSTSYSTGTIANVTCPGTSPNPCTVTGSGTTWTSITGFVGTHTTWNGLSTGGPILTSNLTLCFAPNANDGYDWCVPVETGVSDTSLTVNLYDAQVAENAGWYGATSGSYVIYHSAWPTSVDTSVNTFSAGDISGIGNVGDTLDQVQAYNGNWYGMLIEQQRHIGRPNNGGGLLIQNFGDAGSPEFNFGVDINGAYLYGVQLGGNFGTPQYGLFSGGGGATRIPIWMADLTTPSTTPVKFFEYYRSDGVAQIPIVFDTNVADATEGLELYPSLTPVPFNVSSKGVVTLPAINGNVNVGAAYNNSAGVLGTYQNLLKYSQFDPSSIGTIWNTFDAPAASITSNTTAVTDPNGGNTAEAFVAPSSFGVYGLAGQQQAVTLTSGLPYSAKLCFRGAAGGEFVEYGLSTSPYDATVTLTTSWQCVSISKTVSGTVTPGIFWGTSTLNATVYVAFAQLEQAGSSGYYIHTTSAAAAATNGVYANNITDPNFAPNTLLCTDANGNETTSACATSGGVSSIAVTAPLAVNSPTGAVSLTCPTCQAGSTISSSSDVANTTFTAEQLLCSITIPANALSGTQDGPLSRMSFHAALTTTGAGSMTIGLNLNASNVFAGASRVVGPTATATAGRTYIIDGQCHMRGSASMVCDATISNLSNTLVANVLTSTSFSVGSPMYWVISGTQTTSTDTTTCREMQARIY